MFIVVFLQLFLYPSTALNRDPEPFDWYQRYSGVRDLINQYVKREDMVLMAGCGNSRLTEDMFEGKYDLIQLSFCDYCGYITIINKSTNTNNMHCISLFIPLMCLHPMLS
jgi:hypothetical protein